MREYNLRGRHLVVAVPAMDGRLPLRMVGELLKLLPLLAKHGVAFSLHQVSQCALINSARNQLVAAFMSDPTATDHLFLDSDIIIKAEDIVRLLCHATVKDVVAATYRKKEDKVTYHGHLLNISDPETGLLKADRAPTGCLLIRREVYTKMMDVFADFKYSDDRPGVNAGGLNFDDSYLYDLFSIMVVDGRLIGEDYFFTLRYHSIGGEIWIDPMIPLIHIGNKDYEGRFADSLGAVNDDKRDAESNDV